MFSKALLISSLFSVAFATVFITSPTSSSTFSGGKAGAMVAWEENGNSPMLATFGPAMISIYVGNAIQQTSVQVISNSTDVSTTSNISFTPDPTIGPTSSDYFIRIESLNGKDNTSTPYEAFSAKFTLNDMTGSFSSSILAEIAGQSTAPLALPSLSQASPTSTPSLTSSSASKNPTSTSSTASATASGGALGLKAGWVSIAFGVVVGVAMF